MKAIILAGGYGSRLSEYTKKIPKPMVKINKVPILVHIINHYIKYGVTDFLIASGYKHHVIKSYFEKNFFEARIRVVNTGLNSLTALRIKKLQKYFKENENFFLTYGDAVSDINLKKLLLFHIKSKKIATLTCVHPPARFGELTIKKNSVSKFIEKPQLQEGWINGGFFVLNAKIFSYLKRNKNEMFERGTIQKIIKSKNLNAFRHDGFWMCMDTLRDKLLLEKSINNFL